AVKLIVTFPSFVNSNVAPLPTVPLSNVTSQTPTSLAGSTFTLGAAAATAVTPSTNPHTRTRRSMFMDISWVKGASARQSQVLSVVLGPVCNPGTNGLNLLARGLFRLSRRHRFALALANLAQPAVVGPTGPDQRLAAIDYCVVALQIDT